MFNELKTQQLRDIVPIGHAGASWLLRDGDLEWLNKEYKKMFDFLKDSPAYQWMRADAREEAWQEVALEKTENPVHVGESARPLNKRT
jgi:ATP sulfurylase